MNEPSRRPVLISQIQDIDDAEYDDGIPTDEELSHAKFRAEMDDGAQYAKINVFRQPETSDGRRGQRKLTFLFECGLDEYEYSQFMSKLRDEYGTGTYRMQGRDSKGSLLFNRAVSVEAPKNEKQEPRGQNPAEMLGMFQRIIGDQQTRTEELFGRLMQPGQAQQGGDMMQHMAMVMGMVTQLTAVINGNKSEAPDLLKEMQKFAAFKEAASVIAGDSGGGAGATVYDTLNKTVETFGPLLMQGLAANSASQAPGHRAQPRRLPPPGAAPPVIRAQAPKVNPEPIKVDSMQPNPALVVQVNALLANARNGIQPEQMARSVIGLTPDSQLDELFNFIARPDVIEVMQAVNPEVTVYLDWFKAVRDHLLAELEPEMDDDGLQMENSEISLGASSDLGPGTADDAATNASDVTGNS